MTNNVACPLGIECRTDYGLICQSGTCLCNSSYQFWSVSATPNRCVNYFNYTETCSAIDLCNPWSGLICNSGSNCSCPIMSSVNQCDCPREANNETYWNGTHCTPARAIGSLCTDLTTNYLCQTETQGTICNMSSGVFKCMCPPMKYFNGTYCVDQGLNNVPCPIGDECRVDLGRNQKNSII